MRPAGETVETRAAYRRCEEITWSQARNFSYGIRLLPGPKRQALAAVYAFARRVDDIGDGTLPPDAKLTDLGKARASLAALTAGTVPGDDLVLVALADAARRFEIPLAAFGELIDGCEADVRGTTYRTFGDLLHYCRCVAGSIGRLSLGVFGTRYPERAVPLADALGVALQLTNILRDITEDHASGRVYLPAEDLERFGCSLDAGGGGGNFAALVAFEAARAREWYTSGLALMPLLDRRSAACAGAMAGIYFKLLQHIAATPGEVLARRMSLSGREKALVAAKCLATAALRPRRSPGPGGPRRPAARGPATDGGPASRQLMSTSDDAEMPQAPGHGALLRASGTTQRQRCPGAEDSLPLHPLARLRHGQAQRPRGRP